MPWCPNCRNEYKAGYTVCADCGCELVENLSEIEKKVAYFGSESEIATMVDFLTTNGFKNVESRYDEKEEQYELLVDNVDDDNFKRAMTVYFTKIVPEMKRKIAEQATYYTPEIEEQEQEQRRAPLRLNSKNKIYEKPEDRAAEYKSGAATLLIVGIIGFLLLILADLGIIHFPMYGSGKILINVVMGGMFAAFIVLGIMSARTYKNLIAKADSANGLEADILNWLDEHLTVDMIKVGDAEGESEESAYFNRIAIIKAGIIAQFPDTEESFLFFFSEKVYSKYFE